MGRQAQPHQRCKTARMEPVPLRYLPDDGLDLDKMLSGPRARRIRKLKTAPWRPGMMAQGRMVIYANVARSREKIEVVRDMGAGIGQHRCWDCDGTGVFEGPEVCNACKGSGKDYVSI
jgi:hypothetical protein